MVIAMRNQPKVSERAIAPLRAAQWIVMLAASCLAACVSTSEPSLTATRDAAVLVDDVNDPAWPADHIVIDSAVVTADGRVRLFTWYGGGCEEHAVALLVGTAMMESHPVRLRARLAHNANGDPCDAIVYSTFEFQLEPVRRHFRRSYPSGPGVLVLGIDGTAVTYSFP